ncbi:MAG: YceI family protein [Acidimicrobiia bacterium]|nr:YceI family protein [Acidimicrobiia bacterium]
MDSQEPPRAQRSRKRLTLTVVGVGLAVLVALGAVGYFVWFGGSAPPEVSLSDAVADTESTTTGGAPTPAGSSTAEGTWTVDPSLTAADGSPSFAGFRVEEELGQGIGHATAVGRTEDVTGTVVISGSTVESAEFTADLTTITSDRPRRDDKIQEALETGTHPEAEFVLTAPIELGTVPTEGESVSAEAKGELTVHGVTRDVTVDIEAELNDGVLAIVGTTDVVFADYDVAVPSSMIVISVEDHGVVELQMFLARQ